MHKIIKISLFLLVISACSDTSKEAFQTPKATNAGKHASNQGSSTQIGTSLIVPKIVSLSDESFSILKTTADSLRKAVIALTKAPSTKQLEITRREWSNTHNAYIATRLFRQWSQSLKLEHPELDIAQDSPMLSHTNQSRIDQHPILPGYLDSVQGYPFSGLIHSELELSAQTLNEEHMLGDNAYVTLGFHALGFMLFGEPDHPRLIKELSQNQSANTKPDTANIRRVKYIELLSKLLKDDIDKLADAWIGEKAFYPSQLSLRSDELLSSSLQQIAEVELEACKQIETILQQANQQSHDTPVSIAKRTDLANKILNLLGENKSKS